VSADIRRIALSLFVWSLGEGTFLYIQPLYIRSLGASPAQIGTVLGLASLGTVLFYAPAGHLGDRLGRRPVLLAGWLLGLAAALIMYFAPSLPLFTVGIVLYFSTAFVSPVVNSYVAHGRGQLSVQRAITAVAAIYGAGAVASPVLGGLIAAHLGLRTVYGVAALLFAVSTAILIPVSRQALLSVPGQPLGPSFSGNRDLRRLLVLVLAAGFAMYISIPLAPNYLQQVYAVPIEVIGLFGSASALGLVVLNSWLGTLHPRQGWILAQGMVLSSCLLLWFGSGLPFFLIGYFLRAGFGVARSLSTSLMGRLVEGQGVGLAFGLSETANGLAMILAPVLAGVLFERHPWLPFAVGAVLVGLTMLLTWGLTPRAEREPGLLVPASRLPE
jgi:MFS family permease